MRTRDEKLTGGFLNAGFSFKNYEFKPLTAQTLLILEKVKSPFFTGEGSDMRGLLDYLLASSKETKELLPLTRDADAWELAVMEFAGTFTQEDLEELGELVAGITEEATSAVVEVRDDATGTKKKSQKNHIG